MTATDTLRRNRAVPISVPARPPQPASPSRLSARGVGFFYGDHQALWDVCLEVPDRRVTALIGPSACGKSTLLRVFNRIYDIYRGHRATGSVLFDGTDILAPEVDLHLLRRRIGMVYQQSTVFPYSIFGNVAFGLQLHTDLHGAALAGRVEQALPRAALWDEVKDRLHESAHALSGGQQQRLCIARAIAVDPDVLLLDEPCAGLDPASSAKVEDLIDELRRSCSIVIVTHNMQQAARVSDFTAFMYLGRIIEHGTTEQMFIRPREKHTQDYLAGRTV